MNSNSNNKNSHIYTVVSYTKGLSKSLKDMPGEVRVQVHYKGSTKLWNLLVAPKDKHKITQKCKVIYSFKCTQADCEEEYIGESGRGFERFKEHLSTPSIYDHGNT